jgi:hypothetical protein
MPLYANVIWEGLVRARTVYESLSSQFSSTCHDRVLVLAHLVMKIKQVHESVSHSKLG